MFKETKTKTKPNHGVPRGTVPFKVTSKLSMPQSPLHHLSPAAIITSGCIPARPGEHLVLVWLEGCVWGLQHPVPWQQRFGPNASVEKHHVCIKSQKPKIWQVSSSPNLRTIQSAWICRKGYVVSEWPLCPSQ